MSIVSWPGFKVATIRWTLQERAALFQSNFSTQALVLGPSLWAVELAGVPEYWHQAHRVSAFLESLQGYGNQLALWNLAHPYPLGTMRGNMVLAANAAQGARTLQISGGASQAGTTLLPGDLLGLGAGITQQVVRVHVGAVADDAGIASVGIGTPLRNAFSVGAPVTWDKPKALFRQMNLNQGIEYASIIGRPWALSLIEDWRT